VFLFRGLSLRQWAYIDVALVLDIPKALDAADRALADVTYSVECLQQASEGHYPPAPEAAQVLANVAAVREMLGWVIPPRLQEEIAKEQAMYDEEAAR